MENLIISINCVIPIFVTFLVGYYARSRRIVPESVFPQLSTLCFHVLLPVMMFNNVYSADFREAFSARLLTFLVLATCAVFGIACILSFAFVRDHRYRGTLIQVYYRSNIAVVGVALAQVLMDASGVATMTIAVSVLVPMYNVFAVIALELCRGGKVRWGQTLKNVARNPLILGTVLGAAFLLLKIRLPLPVESAVSSIGKTGSVMTLIALGASFDFSKLGGQLKRMAFCSALRLILVPAAVLAVALLLGYRDSELAVILICTGTPIATTTFPMAQVYDSDYELAGQLVVSTSMLSCLSMFLWIFALKEFALL